MRLVITQGCQAPFVLPNGDFLTLRGGQEIPPELLRPGMAERLIRLGYAKPLGAPEPVQKELILQDPGPLGSVAPGNAEGAIPATLEELEGRDRGERGGMQRHAAPPPERMTERQATLEILARAREEQKRVREALGCGHFCFPREVVASLTLSQASELAKSIDSAAPVFRTLQEATTFLTRDLQQANPS